MNPLAHRLTDALLSGLPDDLPPRLGVAVSGGGDSVALLHLLSDLAQERGISLLIATVDHGLRDEAAAEAQWVGRQAAARGLPHETLEWRGWDKAGNLQDQARQARYRLLSDWARRNDIAAVALGHTADDQAETFLMRLGRSAGITGLSAMSPSRSQGGVTFLRPLMQVTRQQLRDYLNGIGADWIEDPSNHDPQFDRVKARTALAGLYDLGISAQSLSCVAQNLAQAREALVRFTQDTARHVLRVDGGDICVDRARFQDAPTEIQRRLLIGCVSWIAGPGYPPRRGTVDRAVAATGQGETTTLGGCLITPKGENAWISRELNAVSGQTAAPGLLWDRRWIISGPDTPLAQVRPLGDAGLKTLANWREIGKPRAALLASPAVWLGDDLLAAPLAGFANGWTAKLGPDTPEFNTVFLSH